MGPGATRARWPANARSSVLGIGSAKQLKILERAGLFGRQCSAADQPLDLIDERLDLVDGWADLAVVQIGRRNVEPVERGVAQALIFGRQGFSRQGSRRRGGTFVPKLTEGIRSISEIDALKTSLKGKTVEVDVVTATTP